MSDNHQAVYDAVRSRFGYCDASSAMESVLRECFGMASTYIESVAREYQDTAWEQQRPSVLMKPALKIDGNMWCALYGDNLQDGVAGFGESPSAAMDNFDAQWVKKLN